MLALAVPNVLFVVFGLARVDAPVSAIGLLFDEPAAFAVVAAVVALVGAALLFVEPVELAVARVIAGDSRPPGAHDAGRLGSLLGRAGRRAGIDWRRLIVRVKDDSTANAGAGAGHLLFVTTAALDLPDDELEAILAHELGHHRGLHPVMTAVIWWLSLPGTVLAAVYRELRRTVGALGQRLGTLGRVIAVPLLVLLIVWQIVVMWIWWVGDVLAMRAARISELEADTAAARWGYAATLAAAYERLAGAEAEPANRLARLRAEHPPISERIERLRAYTRVVPAGSSAS